MWNYIKKPRMWRLFLITILAIFTVQGCKHARNSSTATISFEDLVQEVIADDTMRVEAKWHNARQRLNPASSTEVTRWLEVQQLILMGKIAKNSYGSMQRVAIQEFWFHLEHTEPFKPWLNDCLKKEVFKDPFVNKYIHQILQDGQN